MRKFLIFVLACMASAHPVLGAADTGGSYLCIGTEPAWRLDLWPGEGRFKYSDQPVQNLSGQFTQADPPRLWTWRGKSSTRQRRDLVATLRGETCSDGASGRQYPFSIAVATPDGKRLSGCCRLPETAAQPAKSRIEMLSGAWLRRAPDASGKGGKEGFNLAADGKLSLIGIRSMKGEGWRLDGDDLVLTTETGRDPQPVVNRMHIEELSDSALVLSAPSGDLAGTYQREVVGRVTGTVTYRQRIALPPDAVVEVKLVDVSAQDVAAKTIGEQTIRSPGQVPVPFEIGYDAALIQARHRYAIQARILVEGKLSFTNTLAYPVITMGSPSRVDVVVQPTSR